MADDELTGGHRELREGSAESRVTRNMGIENHASVPEDDRKNGIRRMKGQWATGKRYKAATRVDSNEENSASRAFLGSPARRFMESWELNTRPQAGPLNPW